VMQQKKYEEDHHIDDIVKPEDRNLVRDVINMLSALQHPINICTKWTVTLKPTKIAQYEITGLIDTKTNIWHVSLEDLDMIKQLNFSRINSVCVKGNGSTVEISVTVTSFSERAMITEYDVVRVYKRKRLM